MPETVRLMRLDFLFLSKELLYTRNDYYNNNNKKQHAELSWNQTIQY